MSACTFCQLLAGGDLPTALSNLIHETAGVVALVNRRPVAPGHVTLILKAHLARTSALRDADLASLGDLSGRLSAVLEREYTPARVVFLGDGKPSAHVHFHLIPELAGETLDLGAAIADLNLAVRPPTLPEAETRASALGLRRALAP